jgi:hypothetical protein
MAKEKNSRFAVLSIISDTLLTTTHYATVDYQNVNKKDRLRLGLFNMKSNKHSKTYELSQKGVEENSKIKKLTNAPD